MQNHFKKIKKVCFIVSIFSYSFFSSQEKEFKMTKDGFTDYIVVEKEGKTAKELYIKTIEWINKFYNSPKDVIKGQIENEYIRIEGIDKKFTATPSFYGNKIPKEGKYQIEISFKDGKYKFDVISLSLYSPPSRYSIGSWEDFKLNNVSEYYRNNGDIKGWARFFPTLIPEQFNLLNAQLSNYISGEGVTKTENNW